jgi:putative SOS response-associated peptidase YedK
MCGRYLLTFDIPRLEDSLQAVSSLPEGHEYLPRYNAAPLQFMPVLRLDGAGARELALLRWGLLPGWARDESMAAKMINARSEGIETKPAFREAFRRRRCLVPATGWYEWRREGAGKQPYSFTLPGQQLICFAGLWESRRSEADGGLLETFTIITREALGIAAVYHERMPLGFAHSEQWQAWLNPQADAEQLSSLLSAEPGNVEVQAVDPALGNVRNDHAGLLKSPPRQSGLLD